MKEFIKKYGLIVFLVVMIIILAFVKSFSGNKLTENKQTKENKTENISNNLNNIGQSDSTTTTNETENKTEEVFNELFDKYVNFENVDERENWVNNLSSEEQKILAGEEAVIVTDLNNELPYEGDTFIVKNIPSNSLLIAKSKIDDLEKAEADLRDWLSSKEMNFGDLVIAWE